MNETINKNYYYKIDDSGRLTVELTKDKSMSECIQLTMNCINEINSKSNQTTVLPPPNKTRTFKTFGL